MMDRLKQLSFLRRRQDSDYEEIPSHDSWNANHQEYLDNLGAPMLSSLLVNYLVLNFSITSSKLPVLRLAFSDIGCMIDQMSKELERFIMMHMY